MTNFMRTLLIDATFIAGALLLACGGDTDNDQPPGEAATELRDLAARFGEQEIKIEYQLTSGAAGDLFDGTMTLYWKPPDAQRTDLSSSAGDVTLINTAAASYICTSEVGAGQCLESPIGDELTPDFFGMFTEPGNLTGQIDAALADVDIEQTSRTIAGQEATCFALSGTTDGETGAAEYCFRDDGVLLLLRAGGGLATEGGGAFSLEAISVEDSVSDSDLEPPYELFDPEDLIP